MITVVGFQFKSDEHCIGLSRKKLKSGDVTVTELILNRKKYEYNKIRTVVIDYVYEDHDKDKYDITIWENVCRVANSLNCTCVCRYKAITYIAKPSSAPQLVKSYHEALQKNYLHKFGPDAPSNCNYPSNRVLYNFHHLNSYNETIKNYTEELEKMRGEKAQLIFYTFASDIEDEVQKNEFPNGTSKVVKLYVHTLYKFIIGLCKNDKKKYFYYDDLPIGCLVPGGRKDRFIDDRIREHYLDMYIEYCIKFSGEMRKMEVLNECGSIMKKHVYKVYGKNEEVGYSNIMALVNHVCNWSPSYL